MTSNRDSTSKGNPMTDDKITTAIEAVAEAIYEQNPMRDADQDPDGRQIGEAYDIEFKDLLEMDNGLYELATDQAQAAIRAFLATPEVVQVREALTDARQALLYAKADPRYAKWIDVTNNEQDPCGVHGAYQKADEALSALDELERKLKETADGDS